MCVCVMCVLWCMLCLVLMLWVPMQNKQSMPTGNAPERFFSFETASNYHSTQFSFRTGFLAGGSRCSKNKYSKLDQRRRKLRLHDNVPVQAGHAFFSLFSPPVRKPRHCFGFPQNQERSSSIFCRARRHALTVR